VPDPWSAPAAAVEINQVPVGTAPARIDTGLAARKRVVILNTGAATVYLGVSSAITPSAASIPLTSGSSATLAWGESVEVYAVSGSAGQSVAVSEEA
jgi:hypothetical protein